MLLIILSMMFLFTSHPMSMGIVLILQTLSISLYIGMYSLNFWFSYILILILIGAMLILFIYMTSIASNEKFKFNPTLMIPMMLIMLLSTTSDQTYTFNSYLSNSMLSKNSFSLTISKFYNMPSNMMIITLVIYLLITLIAVASICKSNKSPLRQMF